MSVQTINLLVDAALLSAATAGVVVALGLASVAAYQVWKAVYSPAARRRQEFNKRLARNKAHNRRMLGLDR